MIFRIKLFLLKSDTSCGIYQQEEVDSNGKTADWKIRFKSEKGRNLLQENRKNRWEGKIKIRIKSKDSLF